MKIVNADPIKIHDMTAVGGSMLVYAAIAAFGLGFSGLLIWGLVRLAIWILPIVIGVLSPR